MAALCLVQQAQLLLVVLFEELEERLHELDLVNDLNASLELFPVLAQVLDVALQVRLLSLRQCTVDPCELIVDLLILGSVATELLLELEDCPDVLLLEAATVLVGAVASYEGHVVVLLSHEQQHVLDAVLRLVLIASELRTVALHLR